MKFKLRVLNQSLLVIFPLVLAACNNGTTSSTTQSNESPVVTLLTTSQLSESTLQCYESLSVYTFNVGAVNNNGVVAGDAQSDPSNNCLQSGYLWNSTESQFTIIPPISSIPSYTVTGASIDVISTNLVTGGITYATKNGDGYEFATYYTDLTSHLIFDSNYGTGISEDGHYLVGYTLFGTPLLYDTITQTQNESLTYESALIAPPQEMAVYSVSNTGVAVASLILSPTVQVGTYCINSTSVCTSVTPAESNNLGFLRTITPDGSLMYGYTISPTNKFQIFSFTPATNTIKPLVDNYFIQDDIMTSDGTVVISKADQSSTSIYVGQNNKIYSLKTLESQLALPSNTGLTDAYLSPNGNYLTLNTSTYAGEILGIKIYFPQGITTYLIQNQTPESSGL